MINVTQATLDQWRNAGVRFRLIRVKGGYIVHVY
jgi:hypothetical protein